MESNNPDSGNQRPGVIIRRIAFDADGRLRVYPSGEGDYSYIWRATMSVRWDKTDRSLFVLPVKYFTLADDLNQIIKAVRQEYGTELILDESTVFDMPDERRVELGWINSG